ETFTPEHAQKIESNRKGGMRTGWQVTDLRLHTWRLQSVLDAYHARHIDLLLVSVEGHELQVLQSLDFSITDIKVIQVQIHDDQETIGDISRLLYKAGYRYPNRIGSFLYYSRKDFGTLW
ncbi:hypothetical protein CYMTET_50595, partial [Cymbomonas tetramitiformis]